MGTVDSGTNRFDRQLLMWDIKEQKCLENWHVLLIGSDGLCAEFAKAAIQCGVHHVTIVESESVFCSVTDLSSHPFLSVCDVQDCKPRAEVLKSALQRLAPTTACIHLIETQVTVDDPQFSLEQLLDQVHPSHVFCSNSNLKLVADLSVLCDKEGCLLMCAKAGQDCGCYVVGPRANSSGWLLSFALASPIVPLSMELHGHLARQLPGVAAILQRLPVTTSSPSAPTSISTTVTAASLFQELIHSSTSNSPLPQNFFFFFDGINGYTEVL